MTDYRFHRGIRAASGDGTYWFTENQLLGRIGVQLGGCGWPSVVGLTLFLAGLVVLVDSGPWAIGIGLMIAAVLLGTLLERAWARSGSVMRPEELHGLVERWLDVGHDIPRLIREPALGAPPEGDFEHDVYDYGVERLVIVQRPLLVDWLVRNGWHAESRALVVSADGYPGYLVERANALLDASPELPVLLLHDATAEGARTLAKAREGYRLRGHPVTDLGVRPEDAQLFWPLRAMARADPRFVPVDAIPFAALESMLGECVAIGCVLSEAPSRATAGDGGASTVGTG